jgi:hypothetical protein
MSPPQECPQEHPERHVYPLPKKNALKITGRNDPLHFVTLRYRNEIARTRGDSDAYLRIEQENRRVRYGPGRFKNEGREACVATEIHTL